MVKKNAKTESENKQKTQKNAKKCESRRVSIKYECLKNKTKKYINRINFSLRKVGKNCS